MRVIAGLEEHMNKHSDVYLEGFFDYYATVWNPDTTVILFEGLVREIPWSVLREDLYCTAPTEERKEVSIYTE